MKNKDFYRYDYMDELSKKIQDVKNLIENTDHILIAGGEYLSEQAGLDIYGPMFTDNFQDFIDRYEFTNMYNGTFFPYKYSEEKWAYIARYFHVYLNFEPTQLYKKIYRLVEDKDYFVITSTFDEQFYKTGFPKSKIYASNGDCRHLQCSEPCHNELYDFIELIDRMVKQTDDKRKIPRQLIPQCPKCGGSMDLHLTTNKNFIQDADWKKQHEKYGRFTTRNKDSKTLVLQFGSPKVFEKTIRENPKWHLVRFMEPKGKIGNIGSSLFKPFKKNTEYLNRIITFEEPIEEIVDQLLK